jgi:oligopeptide/dipeptide ABC transporter ATP-binding protein
LLRETGAALLLMSHDLRMVARRCDRVLVMYGGRVIESGGSRAVFEHPRHPYTQALIRAAAGNEGPGGTLRPIAGVPPVLRAAARDCSYAPRCSQVQPRCRDERPLDRELDGRFVACHFPVHAVHAGVEAE